MDIKGYTEWESYQLGNALEELRTVKNLLTKEVQRRERNAQDALRRAQESRFLETKRKLEKYLNIKFQDTDAAFTKWVRTDEWRGNKITLKLRLSETGEATLQMLGFAGMDLRQDAVLKDRLAWCEMYQKICKFQLEELEPHLRMHIWVKVV